MSIADLEEMTVGMVFDVIVESGNDSAEYETIGSLDDLKGGN